MVEASRCLGERRSTRTSWHCTSFVSADRLCVLAASGVSSGWLGQSTSDCQDDRYPSGSVQCRKKAQLAADNTTVPGQSRRGDMTVNTRCRNIQTGSVVDWQPPVQGV